MGAGQMTAMLFKTSICLVAKLPINGSSNDWKSKALPEACLLLCTPQNGNVCLRGLFKSLKTPLGAVARPPSIQLSTSVTQTFSG
jgi:hypothetical protein